MYSFTPRKLRNLIDYRDWQKYQICKIIKEFKAKKRKIIINRHLICRNSANNPTYRILIKEIHFGKYYSLI